MSNYLRNGLNYVENRLRKPSAFASEILLMSHAVCKQLDERSILPIHFHYETLLSRPD